MLSLKQSFLLMLIAFVVTSLVYPYVLAFARKRNIVDNPNARKLQRVPVPLMGGATVFAGMLVASVVAFFMCGEARVLIILGLLLAMYLLGLWDDVKDITPAIRFLVEILEVWLIILLLGVEINDFHGLWGLHAIPDAVSVPLSIVAGVGIINAINLIDGVDGYCSSYGMMTCIVYAIIFYFAGDKGLFTLALIGIGAMLPFFFHNVFGKTSKMFLGDGGSLLLGTLLVLFTFSALSSNSVCKSYGADGVSLVAICLAILAVPIFDTLKVMIFRLFRGQSPFHPDKTHLHHLFIEMGFTHLATSFIIVLTNVFIIAALVLAWRMGASVDLQVYIVVGLSLLFTWGFYFFMEAQCRKKNGHGSKFYRQCRRFGELRLISAAPIWRFFRRVVDSRLLGGKPRVRRPSDTPAVSKSRPDPRIQ